MSVDLTLDNSDLAKAYDEISDSQFANGLNLIGRLGITEGDTVLDIGSGTGRLGRHIAGIIGTSGSLTGIDPLRERIRIANEKNLHSNAVYKLGTAESLSFIESSSVDVVILNAVFHWVVDKETALREIFRVLKHGGRVGITTGAKELSSISGVQAITEGILNSKKYSEVVNLENYILKKHGLTATELILLLTKAGLAIDDIQVKASFWSFQSASELIRHSEASSFGNYLSHVPDSLRDSVKSDIETELEKHRTEEGIKVERHTIFAVAQKRRPLL